MVFDLGGRAGKLLEIAAEDFASDGLRGALTEVIAWRAGIRLTYVFGMVGANKALSFGSTSAKAVGPIICGTPARIRPPTLVGV